MTTGSRRRWLLCSVACVLTVTGVTCGFKRHTDESRSRIDRAEAVFVRLVLEKQSREVAAERLRAQGLAGEWGADGSEYSVSVTFLTFPLCSNQLTLRLRADKNGKMTEIVRRTRIRP